MAIALKSLQQLGDSFYNAITVVDLMGPDQPLVYVNRAFSELTGYPLQEVLGRNCRFLQGPKSSPEDVTKLRNAIRDREAIFCDLLNYRKDGSIFFNRLVLLPIEIDGRDHFIGMQIDSSALIQKPLKVGKTFDQIKTSEKIRDKINTPLMTVLTVLLAEMKASDRKEKFDRAFTQILDTVKNLPFRQV